MIKSTEELIGDRTVLYKQDHYAIVDSVPFYNGNVRFRVINLHTGDETSLYSIPECMDILRLAIARQLLGSFQ